MAELVIPAEREERLSARCVRFRFSARKRWYPDIVKRMLDLILGSIALLLSIPILVVCAIIVKIIDPGPCIYTQVRMGKDGRLFKMYKLRTMIKGAEDKTGPVWARDDDPRVLPYCRWMRRTHIDELPQLINVLRGEMSLVGPRPERPEIIEGLRGRYPYIDRRLEVLPGITGFAQIKNGYDKSLDSVELKLKYDLEYMANYSFLTDLKIIIATLPKFYDKSAH